MCVRCIVLKDVILDWIVLCEVMSNWEVMSLVLSWRENMADEKVERDRFDDASTNM